MHNNFDRESSDFCKVCVNYKQPNLDPESPCKLCIRKLKDNFKQKPEVSEIKD